LSIYARKKLVCEKIDDLSVPVAGCTILAAAPNARFF
jgi:hypothetical protein